VSSVLARYGVSDRQTKKRRWRFWFRRGLTVGLALVLAMALFQRFKPLPAGLSFAGPRHSADQVRFLADVTWRDDQGRRHVEQHIFDEVFRLIEGARRLVLVDMFLWNDFQGEPPERTRALASE